VAAGTPAGTLAQTRSMVHAADENRPALDLLEVAFQTKVRIAFGEQFGVDAAVRGMAGGAAFAQGFVLKNKRPLLGGMALDTVFILRKQSGAAGNKSDSLMRRMTFDATHPSFGHGMMIGQIELAAHVQVALVTDILDRTRRLERVPAAQGLGLWPTGSEAVRRFDIAARILMRTARAVARFATGIKPVFALRDQSRVVGGLEAAADFVVALFAVRGADVFRTGHIREHHGLAAEGAAGNRRQQQNDRAGSERQVPTALAVR